MRSILAWLFAGMILAASHGAIAQGANMKVPLSVTAGNAFTIATTGNGKAAIYIVGPAQVLRRDVQLGRAVSFDAGDLYNAGRYLAILVAGSSTTARKFDVVPTSQPAALGFLAKPSRLPVGLHNGISGAAYIFDAYHNLITTPIPVSFELSNQGSTVQTQTVTTRNGVAWTEMNSAEKQGSAKFLARVGDVSSTRVIQEVPGNPCGLTMSAKPDGQMVELQTTPVKDCAGNPVPDGTIVTFTENYDGMQSTVDAPLKQGIARAEMPSYKGATISVASGVVAGNEIRWEGAR